VIIDVAIVGAGPAGAWAAYTLARAGARVTMVDASHPREKPCGGGVTGRAMALVDGALPAAVPACRMQRARFVDSATGRSATVPLERCGAPDTKTSLLVADRATFDAALLNAARRAGAGLLAARVVDVGIDSSSVRVETTRGPLRARFLIGADGANSIVKRRLARPFRRDELSIATGFFAHGVTSDEIVVEIVDDPPGYIWSFPRPTHLAIGICAQADAGIGSRALRQRTAAWIRDTNIATGARLDAYSWPIPSLGAASLQQAEIGGPQWCAVGDAAGLVDPITREGIYFALLSGAWAAKAVAADRPAHYIERLRDEMVPELARAARIKERFFRLAASGLLIEALQRSSAIAAVMADLIAGQQDYAGLKWRLARTLEWRWAWRALVSARSNRRERALGHRVVTP
jgi:geranylgeranyl reductase family protein